MNETITAYFDKRLQTYVADNASQIISDENCRAGFAWALDMMQEWMEGARV